MLEVGKDNWTCSFPNSGATDLATKPVVSTKCYYLETFISGKAETGNDFGNWRKASKSGMKFEDLDADGVKDAEEPGLGGWTIFVDYDADGVLDEGTEPSAVTSSVEATLGQYMLSGINPGDRRRATRRDVTQYDGRRAKNLVPPRGNRNNAGWTGRAGTPLRGGPPLPAPAAGSRRLPRIMVSRAARALWWPDP